ncbi:MAG: hypothetical protein R3250_01200 [Melioribacteraceae bacterium]|nr:hypothetical protein [Melioribacteraceae bacterium]
MSQSSKNKRLIIHLIIAPILIFTSFINLRGELSDEKLTIFIISDPSDYALKKQPIEWAIGQLNGVLKSKGIESQILYNLSTIKKPGIRVVLTPGESKLAQEISGKAGIEIPKNAESLAIIKGEIKNEPVIMVTGSDTRGIIYGILELADRIAYNQNPLMMLKEIENLVEQPANSIRSMTRLFVSDIEDKSWFYDKEFWKSYLTMLISHRFNRFSLTLGLGYDSPIEVTDSYFIFAYPYLVTVPGYDVKVAELPTGEREKNLEILQYISGETSRRGLHFQLGLWGHAYECVNSPNVKYSITGLSEETHAEYCRAAVKTLLQSCPDIDGITFRAHHESGIPDGSKSFWETVFQGVAECGRRVEIDLHAKGISYNQIKMALNTGQPVFVSPKLTAEHMGLPAHQAAIREMERYPSPNSKNPRNSIARYGYSDFLSHDREYGILFRIWPGKQKIFMWGDPALASGYGRYAGFCGSDGMEVCEPLCFKGRQGSGVSSERRIYSDDSLIPERGNWEKYLYTYRIWGRHLYNPDTDPESYRRYLRYEFGEASISLEKALAYSSRVLPLITSSHLPAGSAMTYWPEMYTNMPITNSGLFHPYNDTPKPKVFGRVSPLDPVMFSPINEFVEDYISGKTHYRYSPVDIANWLEKFATTSAQELEIASLKTSDSNNPSFRRMEIDVSAQNALGLFFANKFRAATAFMFYELNDNIDYLRDAVYFYRLASDSWKDLIAVTENTYISELGFGRFPHIRGHWKDRLPAIEDDLNIMEQLLIDKIGENGSMPVGPSSASIEWLRLRPPLPPCDHKVPEHFIPGMPIKIEIATDNSQNQSVNLHYRHVNQVEDYKVEVMKKDEGTWQFTIPADFTKSDYPLMYFFEILDDQGNGWIYPGFEENLANQPYFHVQRSKK